MFSNIEKPMFAHVLHIFTHLKILGQHLEVERYIRSSHSPPPQRPPPPSAPRKQRKRVADTWMICEPL